MSASIPGRVVVIGGGQAGAQSIFSLRQQGYQGEITLIGDEPVAPYQRPPLSKAYLTGELAAERLFFRARSWYAEHGVECRLGARARAIDRRSRRIELEADGPVPYHALIVATGARPRKLEVPGAGLDGVFELRRVADVDRIRTALHPGARMVIVGGGYIGLEAAASARRLGLEVVVLEYAPRVLARVTSPPVGEFFEREHRARGVDLRTDARVRALEGASGAVTGVLLDGGATVAADLVLVAIGIVPNQELAAAAGLDCDDGILVDRDARTADPCVYAAGDCARRPLVHYRRRARLESVHNAVEQGRLAAAAILGLPRPREECPWFWSDQFDLKLKIAGLSAGYDERIVRGDPYGGKFAVFYLRRGRLIATDAVNSPAAISSSKKLIARGVPVDKALLANPDVPLKQLVAGASPARADRV